MYRILACVLFGIFFISGIAAGQSLDSVNEPNISISINPSDPQPGEEITATLLSYETNLDLAYIKWSHGSKTKSGYGEKEFITTASLNEKETSVITATITLADGRKIERQATIQTSSYDIAFEALDASYPPFYLGKKLPIRENTLRVAVVTPNTSSSQIAYTWQRNDKAFASKGSSKQYIDFKNSTTERSETVSVSIVTSEKHSERTLDISFIKPKTLFYEYNPLNGLELGNIIKDETAGYENTVSVLAVPLGINKSANPVISWKLSGNSVENQQNPRMLSFEKPDDSGIVSLSVEMENLRSLYQEFMGKLSLKF